MNRTIRAIAITGLAAICCSVLALAAPAKKASTPSASVVAADQPNTVKSIPSTSTENFESSLDLTIDPPSAPQPASVPNADYEIDWYSINGGGTVNATSTNYQMGASIGQSVAGAATSTNYNMGIGFWYGAGGGCSCPCAYDPQCDGIISNAQDVVTTVNVAFRGAAAIVDPGCLIERTDVDANGVTNAVDLVKVINVAFRGQTVAANYVDPCS